MQKFYTMLRSMTSTSKEHSRILGDMTRREALVKYGQGLRYIAVHNRGNRSTVQLYEDGILLRSDIVQGWYIMQDKLAL